VKTSRHFPLIVGYALYFALILIQGSISLRALPITMIVMALGTGIGIYLANMRDGL
jgi:hypothetical protein